MSVIPDLSRAAYDALERVNFSTAKHIEKSPAHYQQALASRGNDDDTDARQRGRCCHLAIYEPERLPAEVIVFEGDRRAGKEWKEFEAQHKGKEILTRSGFAAVSAISLAVRSSPQTAPYLEAGKGEVTVLWVDSVTGLECKARIDWVADCGAMVDLKTSKNASPEGFPREVVNYWSHAQAAMYVDGYEAATGERLPYALIAAEPVAPYAVQVYRLTPRVLEIGRAKYRGWLWAIKQCRESGKWPGYAPGELDLQLPRWADPEDFQGAA